MNHGNKTHDTLCNISIWSPFITSIDATPTPKETNHEIKTKRCTFSLVIDADVENSC